MTIHLFDPSWISQFPPLLRHYRGYIVGIMAVTAVIWILVVLHGVKHAEKRRD